MDRRKNPQDIVNVTGGTIAIGLIAILGFLTWALIYVEMPEANQNVLTVLVGILSATVNQVVSFYFGSSSQAKKQADTIDTLAKTAQTAGTTLAGVGKTDALVIPEGASATATATPDGTVITTDIEGKG